MRSSRVPPATQFMTVTVNAVLRYIKTRFQLVVVGEGYPRPYQKPKRVLCERSQVERLQVATLGCVGSTPTVHSILFERDGKMFVCPSCGKKCATEEEIKKHSMACWREANPFHITKHAPQGETIETREVGADVMDFFGSFAKGW